MNPLVRALGALLLTATFALPVTAGGSPSKSAGVEGGPGLAIRCAKALVVPPDESEQQVVDQALILVKDGKIVSVTRAATQTVPDGYEFIDVGENWVMPGLVELHCHVGGTFDINDMVYLTNPGLSSRSAIIPDNPALHRSIAAGVTTVLFIPGSGTNIGGTGVLFKAGHKKYEQALVRDPGAMKLAQWGNPEAWGPGVGMSFEHYNTRDSLRRGVAYAKRWEAFEAGAGPEPEFNIQWEIFRELRKHNTTIATHTQMYQVVLKTLTMVHDEFNLPVFLDHSTIGGWLTGALAAERGVPAICGPRSIDPNLSRGMMNWSRNKHEGFRGVAAGYQSLGHRLVGFNTDSPVIAQEDLLVQAAVGVRYGFEDEKLEAVRGLTVVPAITAKIDDRLGHLSPGCDADLVVISGHIADPRSHVDFVFVDGEKMYDAAEEGQRRW
ncbi:MAG: amidohydrolase family protein [Planctomycetota bacterium]